MITHNKAIEILLASVTRKSPEVKDLGDAFNHVLAENIYSDIDYPPFDQSAMDGYGIVYERGNNSDDRIFKLEGEVSAGSLAQFDPLPGTACRIFTGAQVPEGVIGVAIQEHVVESNGYIHLNYPLPDHGTNIRKKGSDIRAGDQILEEGMLLSAAVASLLASVGRKSVKVYPKPSVTLIVTGSELLPPGENLSAGKIFESNSAGIVSALRSCGVSKITTQRVPDDLNKIKAVYDLAITGSDLVLFTGGVSAGKYDFVRDLLQTGDNETLFYKVSQKPGKPVYAGKCRGVHVFGLPGNPAAALTCFYEYVTPVIDLMCGKHHCGLQKVNARLLNEYTKHDQKMHFLKAYYHNGYVELLDHQHSFSMLTFARANALAVIPEDCAEIHPGENIEVHLLPSL
jgi:molybdopterin molybdotransferase